MRRAKDERGRSADESPRHDSSLLDLRELLSQSAGMALKVFGGSLLLFGLISVAGACGGRTSLSLEANVGDSFDASVPEIDAAPLTPLPAFCADASSEYIYVVSSPLNSIANDLALLAFDPESASFHRVSSLNCPTPAPQWAPFSMAVDHTGSGYVLYTPGDYSAPGRLYKVNLSTGTCMASSFVPGQQGFDNFGMAFAANSDGGETLYVAKSTLPTNGATTGPEGALGIIDTDTFELTTVGTFFPSDFTLFASELTGTGDGRLYAFWTTDLASGSSNIAELDARNAEVIANDPLPTVQQGDAWAFAFFGGDFYLFTSPDSASTTVTRFDPATGAADFIVQTGEVIVGAGVSSCAPQQ